MLHANGITGVDYQINSFGKSEYEIDDYWSSEDNVTDYSPSKHGQYKCLNPKVLT